MPVLPPIVGTLTEIAGYGLDALDAYDVGKTRASLIKKSAAARTKESRRQKDYVLDNAELGFAQRGIELDDTGDLLISEASRRMEADIRTAESMALARAQEERRGGRAALLSGGLKIGGTILGAL